MGSSSWYCCACFPRLVRVKKPDVLTKNPARTSVLVSELQRHSGDSYILVSTQQLSLTQQRQLIITERESIPLLERQKAEFAISEKLTHLSEFRHAKNIACYLAIRGEVSTENIINTIWEEKKTCYLPIMQRNKTLQFAKYESTSTLIQNQQRILEPKLSEDYIEPIDLDVVVVPLVAFEPSSRMRLGYGGGHYDATFNFLLNKPVMKPYLIGIAYDFQKLSDLTRQSWDVPLHAIITPNAVY